MITFRKERRERKGGILEALRRNATTTANLQHEASESGVDLAGAGLETKGARRNKRAKTKKRSGADLPQRHGNGGCGQQPAPPQGASDKTSGSTPNPMPSSASPGISPEPPAAHGPAIVPGLPQRHGTGGRGRQPAPPQGTSVERQHFYFYALLSVAWHAA